ncbi:MAG: FIST C-terminal domain-containing protein [Actinomycetota bacterium]|nr:FIST C-terminal domain-containing protein [Actinomycetota bacterium]
MTRIGAGLSTLEQAEEATREAARAAAAPLRGEPVDLAFVFLSPAHLDEVEEAAEAVREELEPRHLLGCVAEGVVARDRELERGPGAAVWAASLPGGSIDLFHAEVVETDEGAALVGLPALERASLVALLVDPFTFPAGALLEYLAADHPQLPVVGGIATGGGEAGAQALLVDGELHRGGAVGAALGDIAVRAVVSQGCAPIGRDAVITRAEGNVVYELAGQPAFERLREELTSLSPEQRALAMRGLLAGLVVDENLPSYGRGDYLMRGLLGGDEESGALAVGEQVRVGQTLRFHVRDAASADEDLRQALEGLAGEHAAGALLFTCNGRGRNMFPDTSHDARAVVEALGSDGLAGFFCGGEIGPVGGRSFLHGFTATLAVFLDR